MSPDCLADLEIVLVEDHDDARRYLELFLSDLGAKVVVGRNGHEGLKAVKDSSPDLGCPTLKCRGWMDSNCWMKSVHWGRMLQTVYLSLR